MDRTSINLLSILLGGAGLFVTLTKFNVPELNASYFGGNPFALKRDAIESAMTWIFTTVAVIAVLLQVGAEVAGDRVPERLHDSKYYLWFVGVSFVEIVVLVVALTSVGKWAARRTWQPQLVTEMREAFEQAASIVENDGWRPEQLATRGAMSDPERFRRANFETAERIVAQVEKLFEVRAVPGSLAARVDQLRPLFGR